MKNFNRKLQIASESSVNSYFINVINNPIFLVQLKIPAIQIFKISIYFFHKSVLKTVKLLTAVTRGGGTGDAGGEAVKAGSVQGIGDGGDDWGSECL